MQDLVARIMEIYGRNYGIIQDDAWLMAKLGEELGELNSAWLSANGRGRDRGKSPEELAQAVGDEAADLFGFLLYFASRNGIDLEAALQRKWGRWIDAAEPAEGDPTDPAPKG